MSNVINVPARVVAVTAGEYKDKNGDSVRFQQGLVKLGDTLVKISCDRDIELKEYETADVELEIAINAFNLQPKLKIVGVK